jgi:LPXTG-motif cell wall-anchored protein
MNPFKVLLGLIAVALLGTMALPSARADTWNKKTVVTFSQAVEVPGKILPAGTYTFQLLDSPSDRHIVQIFNADGSQIITTILAINNYRLEPKGETVMKFGERPGDEPDALRAWFYPGDNFGQEFVYPKARAIQLAQTTKVAVPAVAVDLSDENAIKTAPIVAVTPEQQEVEVTTVIQTTPPVEAAAAPTPVVAVATPAPVATPEPVAVKETEELPQTGSSMPLIALLGGLSIGIAVGLKLLLKLAS